LCVNQDLGTYVMNGAYEDFSVEMQTFDIFCNKWITRL